MVEEVTFVGSDDSISVLASDKQSRIVIKGTWQAHTGPIGTFTVPSLPKLTEAVKSLFPAEIRVSVNSDILNLESDAKSIKLEIISPNIYPALSKAIDINRVLDTINFTSRGETISYSDSITVSSKSMVKYFKECMEIVPSPKLYYCFDGDKHTLTSTDRKNNIKLNLDISDKFRNNKSIWFFNFIQEIFKQNGPNVNLYINEKDNPIVISYKDSNFDIITISTPYAE